MRCSRNLSTLKITNYMVISMVTMVIMVKLLISCCLELCPGDVKHKVISTALNSSHGYLTPSPLYFPKHFAMPQKKHFIKSLSQYISQKPHIKLFFIDQGSQKHSSHQHPHVSYLISNIKRPMKSALNSMQATFNHPLMFKHSYKAIIHLPNK